MRSHSKNSTGDSAGIFYGWRLVPIGVLVNAISSVNSAAATVFFLPVSQEFGMSRATLAFIFSMSRLVGGIEGPIAGWLIDRFGPRFPAALGAVLGGAGFLLLATVHSPLGFLLVFLGIMSVGFNFGGVHAMLAMANLWFVRYRTRVLSVFSSAIRLGTAIFTPVLAFIVLTHGWRTGAIAAGVLVLAVMLPVTYFIRRSPESMGLLPDGAQPDDVNTYSGEQQRGASQPLGELPTDFTLREALRTPAYWFVAMSFAARTSVMVGVRVHIIPMFVWKGLSEQAGANLAGLAAFITVPLILSMGWLGDRMSKRTILIVGHLAQLLAMLLLVYANGNWTLVFFVVLFAVGESTAPVNHSILGDFFGRKAFATLHGVVTTTGALGMVTPVIAGLVFDRTASYTIALLMFSAIAVLAAFLLLLLSHPQKARPRKDQYHT